MESFFQDLRFGLRTLFRNPAFSIVAVLTLTLGVGANAAIFSVVNAVLLKPLPWSDPDRVVTVLQAVHLLLAMPLFVVVVGVDPRWLLRALRTRYQGILGAGAVEETDHDPIVPIEPHGANFDDSEVSNADEKGQTNDHPRDEQRPR